MPAFKDRRDGRIVWRYKKVVRIPETGERVRISGTPAINTKGAAEDAERKHIERTLNPPLPRSSSPVFGPYFAKFLEEYAAVHNKPSEQKQKANVYSRYLKEPFSKLRLEQLDGPTIERFKSKLAREVIDEETKRTRSPKTVNNVLIVLRKVLAHAHKMGDLAAVPHIEKLRQNRPAVDFLDFDEYAALLKAAATEPLWYPAVVLAGDAGLRKGELRALRWPDWDAKGNRLVVQRSKWKTEEGPTKGWRYRTIPATPRLAKALEKHLRSDLVLCDWNGSEFTLAAWNKAMPRLCKRAGIRSVGWHALRHTFCSHLAMKGAPAKAIQELAGHSDLTTTMRYMHLTPDSKEAAIALLG